MTPALPLPARRWPFGVLFSIAVVLLFGELSFGVITIPLGEVWTGLVTGATAKLTWTRILLDFRLPRAFNALVSGAALGVSGLLLQTVFRNPLADPWALGLVHGARFGVATLVVIVGLTGRGFYSRYGLAGDAALAVFAALGCLVAAFVLLALSRKVGQVTLLIGGLMLGYCFLGLISILLHFIDEAEARVFESWDDGSFSAISGTQLQILVGLTVLGVLFSVKHMKSLNSLLLGEAYAESMGVPVAQVRKVSLLVATLLTGVVTAYCGPIAFLGLLVPHTARWLFRTADHRVLLPGTVLAGMCIAMAGDWIVNLPWSRHFLHLSAVNGLLGAPLVLIMLIRHKSFRGLDT